jgi:hypothetical protein
MLRWEQSDLAAASKLSVETIKRLEAQDGPLISGRASTIAAVEKAFGKAGIEFTNGDQPGIRWKKK